MSLTDEPREAPVDPPDGGQDSEPPQVPTKARLRWPVVEALRVMGDASDDEISDHVAEAMNLTDEQRTEMIPSGVETKLRNRISWAVLELKHIGVLHYPSRGRRALTSLGLEVDEDRVKELRAEYEASKASPGRGRAGSPEPTESPTVWLIRAGRSGERFDDCIEHGLASHGAEQISDLRRFASRADLKARLRLLLPDSEHSDRSVSQHAAQLWKLRTDLRVDDLVVMPRKGVARIALGTITREYRYDPDADLEFRHAVQVDWAPDEVLRTALKQDLDDSMNRPPTLYEITSPDSAWRLQQVLEKGRDPGPRADNDALDLPALVEEFYRETGYPTDAHEEQERLREQWARKLAPENVGDLSPEDLLAYTSNAVDYGQYVTLKEGLHQQWIDDLDPAGYNRLLGSIHDLCWGEDELSTRIDRLVEADGSSRQDTGTTGFAQGNLNATLAICHPDRFLPVGYHGGHRGRGQMLSTLGLPEPRGSTFGQRMVDSHNRLREHLAPHLRDDPQAIACFLYWLTDQKADVGGEGLADLVRRFRAESGYPTEAHEEQKRLRAKWAEKLAPEHIADLSRLDLTAVASHGVRGQAKYVYPKVRGVMQWIRVLDDDEYSSLLDQVRYLCWGEDEAWVRYDQLTDRRGAQRVRGLSDQTVVQLLAISHPKDFLPFGPHRGVSSRLLTRLGLNEPRGFSRGQRMVDANNRLLEHLAPHYGDDTLGMAAFLEWLLQQKQPPRRVNLDELAHKLLVDVEFLEDIVKLLEDKGQVILYGPPGTGKTYLARALATALAPDEDCRALVQFHPSTSYEDFFEGYRPAGTGNDGNVRYELTPGPLARMTERAEDSDQRHVMIIDEINRGNLPRVLGELLFLLEYRDEIVQTLYRPEEEPFSLPGNLWFIGTMNTADRSIALVDAALRRRFHFVPFFPDSGPMAGLLGRWLVREGEPGWVGELVDSVNDELKAELEGSHLLLGPSHFMKAYGSSLDTQRERLRRIWEYNIEPFIEDQFFGDPDRIAHFRFDAVMGRHGPVAMSDDNANDGSGDPESIDGEGEHAAAERDADAGPGSAQPGDE